jgi:hypothetical protein
MTQPVTVLAPAAVDVVFRAPLLREVFVALFPESSGSTSSGAIALEVL